MNRDNRISLSISNNGASSSSNSSRWANRWKTEMLRLRQAYMDPTINTGIKDVQGIDPSREFSFFRDLATFPCEFHVIMEGPEDSAYAKRDFLFSVSIPEGYPIQAPTIRCLTPFTKDSLPSHFFDSGSICCYALSSDYLVSHSIVYLLNCVREVMFEPTSYKHKSISMEEIAMHQQKQEAKQKGMLLITNR